METDLLPQPIGQGRVDPAMFQPIVNMVENALECRCYQAADEACTGREAPVSPNQMLAP
jgi:hypothetical protein